MKDLAFEHEWKRKMELRDHEFVNPCNGNCGVYKASDQCPRKPWNPLFIFQDIRLSIAAFGSAASRSAASTADASGMEVHLQSEMEVRLRDIETAFTLTNKKKNIFV